MLYSQLCITDEWNSNASLNRVILKEIGEIPTVPESQKHQELQLVLETRFKKAAAGEYYSTPTSHTFIPNRTHHLRKENQEHASRVRRDQRGVFVAVENTAANHQDVSATKDSIVSADCVCCLI